MTGTEDIRSLERLLVPIRRELAVCQCLLRIERRGSATRYDEFGRTVKEP